MKRLLFSKMDNSPLILFRISFGILIALECFGALLTGWVKSNFILPQLTFPFIGFEWLQPLPGIGMYIYFGLMGVLGLSIALGYRYRLSILLFGLMWTVTYLMQKTAYNNHYYLLILLAGIMCFLPANRAFSYDVQQKRIGEQHSMSSWIKWIIIAQLWIVYTFAAIAKLYPDWLDLGFVSELMAPKSDYPIIGKFLQKTAVQQVIVWFGIGYDFLVIPLMLWGRSRKFAFIASIFFHLFNAITLHIGIFPFLSLALMAFFFDPETIRARFFPRKPKPGIPKTHKPQNASLITIFLALYLLIQIGLPLRHYAIEGDVLWTEEGHRLSWRMMLRNRQGITRFRVENKSTGENEPIDLKDYLTPSQQEKVMAYPDFMWQFAQHLKRIYAAKGKDIAVYAKGRVRINNRPFYPIIDDKTDLASVPWDPYVHSSWILPPPDHWPYTEKINLIHP